MDWKARTPGKRSSLHLGKFLTSSKTRPSWKIPRTPMMSKSICEVRDSRMNASVVGADRFGRHWKMFHERGPEGPQRLTYHDLL